mgnify:FL=1
MAHLRRKIKQKQKTFSAITEKLHIRRRKFTYRLSNCTFPAPKHPSPKKQKERNGAIKNNDIPKSADAFPAPDQGGTFPAERHSGNYPARFAQRQRAAGELQGGHDSFEIIFFQICGIAHYLISSPDFLE